MIQTQTKKISFLHTADWHIRDVQYGRRFRGIDYQKSIRQIVDLAIQNKVDFIINGGDTLHINRPSETMLEFLFEIHQLLKEAGIPMYTVTGNHDASNPSFLQFPARQDKEPGKGGIVCIDNQVVEIGGIRISGFTAIPFGPKPNDTGARELDTKNGITLLDHVTDRAPVDICVWHGALDEFVPFPMSNSGSMLELPANYARAWLLGDIHLRDRKRLENGVLVSYPGPPEMCERGEPAIKYVDHYTLEPDWRERPFPEPIELELQTRPVIFLSVADDAQADQALQRIRQSIAENPGHSPMIFARYAREQKPWVNRVHELIDPKETVFRAAAFGSAYRGPVAGLSEEETLPSLPQIADEVVPPGTPVNQLARKLVLPDMNIRHEIVTWVENILNPDITKETPCA
jgi:exonuclease SbcD